MSEWVTGAALETVIALDMIKEGDLLQIKHVPYPKGWDESYNQGLPPELEQVQVIELDRTGALGADPIASENLALKYKVTSAFWEKGRDWKWARDCEIFGWRRPCP